MSEVDPSAPRDPGAPPSTPAAGGGEPRPGAWSYASAAASIAVFTAIGLAAYDHLVLADLAMLYLVAIAVAAVRGRGPALLASTLAVLAFDLCFVPPRFTFAVGDLGHIATFAVMFGAGLVISTLTARLERQERDARERERHTAALLAFTRDVAAADGVPAIAAATVRHVEDLLGVAASVLVPERGGDGATLAAAAGLVPLAAPDSSVARWSFEHGLPAGRGTATLPGAAVTAVPLRPGDETVGVLVAARRPGGRGLDAGERHLVDTMARQAGLAIGRARLATEAHDASVRARTEELRSSLLSAVSHDLRTPLAVITGAATSLRDDAAAIPPAAHAELVGTIVEEARRLERVLQNLLGITRLETGLEPAREWVPVVELWGSALHRLEDVIGDRAIELALDDELMVPVDPVLFEQALINLIENAVKHGPPPTRPPPLREGGAVVMEVTDRGAGLVAGTEARLFEKFFRAPGTRVTGVGLGLAVVRGVVVAHGGTVEAAGAPGGGARLTIRLPAPPPPAATGPDEVAA